MAVPSPTAGGPAGTTFSGPIRTTREVEDASGAGFPTAISVVGPLHKLNMPVNASAFMSVANVAGQTGITICKAGSLVGISVCRNTANTTGSWSIRVKKNGTIVKTVAGAAPVRVLNFFQSNLASFPTVAGDVWTAKMITSSGYASSTGDFAAWLWFQ